MANKLKLNYHYYVTNQLMKPLLQLLGLAVEDILRCVGKKGDLTRFRMDIERIKKSCGSDLETFAKMREKVASSIVQTVLFDPVLIRLNNNRKGLQSLADMWK